MALTTAKTEDAIITKIDRMSELELCTFLEKLNELIIDRRQTHLIGQCFTEIEDLEQLEIERNEYLEKLEAIEMAFIGTKEDDLKSLQTFYAEVGCQLPI